MRCASNPSCPSIRPSIKKVLPFLLLYQVLPGYVSTECVQQGAAQL